jgi:hypothetical protein
MQNLLDRDTADRLLSGAVAPDDAPPGYAEVAGLLQSCAQHVPLDSTRERTTIVAMAERIRAHRPVSPSTPGRVAVLRSVRLKLIGVGVGAMLVTTSGLAFAGELPAPAQRIAHAVFWSIGLDIPTPGSASSADVTDGSALPTPTMIAPPATKGDEISALATGHLGRPGEHGAIVSSEASDGNSQAGQPHGESDQPHGESDQPHGQSDQPHGQSDQPHGQSDQPHGQSDQPHGQSDQPHGQSDQPHGQSDQPHGQSDQPHGQSDQPHG